jgi:hypothetical protein
MNVQIFQIVLNLQNIITQVPGQIERQQPVDFIDALGQHTPFHLEFITSAEALKFVLQCNVRDIGSGATKIANGEFAIQDLTTKRDVDLQLPWKACFSPGQQVAMSMIFNSAKATNMCCPKCRENNGDKLPEDKDIECWKCKMVYRRSISWNSSQLPLSSSMMTAEITPATEALPRGLQVPENVSSLKTKPKAPYDEDNEMALFRRVRIKTTIELPAPPAPFDSQNQSNIQQTSSYWSVPEQTDFPALLRHFGTDWHGIAKWMTSKTHIMVYTTVFQQWLVVPQDTNKSRRVTNIQTQVKNYYQRQVDSGKMKEWEDIARDADDKKSRGEETGPLPQPTTLPKRRYDMPPGNVQRSGSAMEGVEDMTTAGQNSM